MRRTRKGTSKGTSKQTSKQTSKRRYKRTSKRTSKRVARKQSGGEINMTKLKEVVNQRSRSSALAAISAEKAKKFKEQINLL